MPLHCICVLKECHLERKHWRSSAVCQWIPWSRRKAISSTDWALPQGMVLVARDDRPLDGCFAKGVIRVCVWLLICIWSQDSPFGARLFFLKYGSSLTTLLHRLIIHSIPEHSESSPWVWLFPSPMWMTLGGKENLNADLTDCCRWSRILINTKPAKQGFP